MGQRWLMNEWLFPSQANTTERKFFSLMWKTPATHSSLWSLVSDFYTTNDLHDLDSHEGKELTTRMNPSHFQKLKIRNQIMESESEINSRNLPIIVSSTGPRKDSPSCKNINKGSSWHTHRIIFNERRMLSDTLNSIPYQPCSDGCP